MTAPCQGMLPLTRLADLVAAYKYFSVGIVVAIRIEFGKISAIKAKTGTRAFQTFAV